MIIDLGSFAFGAKLRNGTGSPSWGTQLGQQKPLYKLRKPDCNDLSEIMMGMIYCSIPLKNINLPLGKGGKMINGLEDDGIQLAAVFKNVFVNGKKINQPFAMVLYKEDTKSHKGRRTLKYTSKTYFKDEKNVMHSNINFIIEVRKTFGLATEACWFIHEISIKDQDTLYMTAYFVNKQNTEYYRNSQERKDSWISFIEDHKCKD